MRGELEVVEAAELSRLDHPPGLAVARVEAPLEPELEGDAGALDLRGNGERRLEALAERLLAERRLATTDRRADELRMGCRRRGDDHRIGGVERGLERGCRRATDLRGRFRRP